MNAYLTSSQVARSVANSYWADKRQGAVYGIYLWSDSPTPNTVVPFALTIKVYVPNGGYWADMRQYRGWVKTDGSILMSNSTDGYQGQLSPNGQSIVWSDGQVWQRVQIQPTNTIDQYSAQGNLDQAAQQNELFHKRFEASYPRYERSFPYGSYDL